MHDDMRREHQRMHANSLSQNDAGTQKPGKHHNESQWMITAFDNYLSVICILQSISNYTSRSIITVMQYTLNSVYVINVIIINDTKQFTDIIWFLDLLSSLMLR